MIGIHVFYDASLPNEVRRILHLELCGSGLFSGKYWWGSPFHHELVSAWGLLCIAGSNIWCSPRRRCRCNGNGDSIIALSCSDIVLWTGTDLRKRIAPTRGVGKILEDARLELGMNWLLKTRHCSRMTAFVATSYVHLRNDCSNLLLRILNRCSVRQP